MVVTHQAVWHVVVPRASLVGLLEVIWYVKSHVSPSIVCLRERSPML